MLKDLLTTGLVSDYFIETAYVFFRPQQQHDKESYLLIDFGHGEPTRTFGF